MGKPLTEAAFVQVLAANFSLCFCGDAEQWFYFMPWHSPDLQKLSMPRASHIHTNHLHVVVLLVNLT